MNINKRPEYFLTVAAEKSISKASEKLYVSQPYLSQHIMRLEESFHAKFIERSPFRLTNAGQIYARYLESSQQMYQKLIQDLDAASEGKAQPLRLGFSNWRAGTLLPDILPAFTREYPDIQMEFFEVPNSGLYRLLAQDSVDVVIMNITQGIPDYLTTETIMYEKILLVGHRDNPMTGKLLDMVHEGAEPDLRLLEHERVLMLPAESAMASHVTNYIDHQGVVLQNVVHIANAATALNLAAQNYGYCFLNETGTSFAPNADRLAFLPFRSEDMTHPLCAVYKKNSYLTPIARAFIDMMLEYYRGRKTEQPDH